MVTNSREAIEEVEDSSSSQVVYVFVVPHPDSMERISAFLAPAHFARDYE